MRVKLLYILIDENRVKPAGPGENLRVRLSNVDEEDILSGLVMSSVGEDFYQTILMQCVKAS